MNPPHFTHIETPRLLVRRLEDRDLEAYVAYRSHPNVTQFQGWSDYTLEKGQTFIDSMKDREPGQHGWFQFALEHRESGTIIGDCALHTLDSVESTAEIGYTLAPDFWGQGLAFEAVQAVLEYVFDTLHIHRVMAYAAVQNQASWKLLERLGFRREAHTLESYRIHGVWHDEYLYALLAREWRA